MTNFTIATNRFVLLFLLIQQAGFKMKHANIDNLNLQVKFF